MGVDFSHCNAHWAYSGFMRFRQKLADQSIGVDLLSMHGYGGDTPWENFDDDIIPLLNHSDCEDDLTFEECAKIAPRLKEIIENWDDGDYDKRSALELIVGMEECILNEESLSFH